MIDVQEDLRCSFYEISEILRYMPIEYNKKLPEKFKDLINENKTSNGFIYNKEKTLDKQEMLHDTKVLLSILYRTYWCSEQKRKELEEEDNRILREKYNPDNIFKKHNKAENEERDANKKEVAMVTYKETLFKKIINRIKSIKKKDKINILLKGNIWRQRKN